MKYISYTILFILCICPALAGGVWKLGPEHPNGYALNNSPYPMYAYGDSLFILHGLGQDFRYFIQYTTDGGKKWNKIMDKYYFGDNLFDSYTKFEDVILYFYPPSTLQIAPFIKKNTCQYISTDMGKHWNKKIIKHNIPDSSYLGVRFESLDTLTQTACFKSLNDDYTEDRYLFTNDGWRTNRELKMPDGYPHPQLINDSSFGAVYNNGSSTVMLSHDMGKTWSSVQLPNPLGEKCFANEFKSLPNQNIVFVQGLQEVTDNGFYVNNILWKSSDGGYTWKTVLIMKDSSNGYRDWSFNDQGYGMLLTEKTQVQGEYHQQNGVYMTTDYGETWQRTPVDTTLGWSFKCAIANRKNAWLYIHPELYRYYPDDTLSVVSDFVSEPGSQIKIYPNPLSIGQSMGINIDASITEDLSIDVYSSDGKLVDSHNFRGKIDQVQYTPDSGIKAGVYYLQIRYGKSNIIKNFVVE